MTQLGSYEVEVVIRPASRMAEVNEREIATLWASALISDLFSTLNSTRPVATRAPAIARKARTWIKDALERRLGAEYGKFDLDKVHIYLFSLPGLQGDILAKIEPLEGTYTLPERKRS